MYKLLPRHLGPRTALIISLLLTIIMAAHTWNTIAHSSKRLTASIKQQADVMARSIANLSVGYVLLNDFGSLETLLLRNVEFPDIVSISVSDPQGKVLSCVLHEGEKTRAVYDHHHIEVPTVAKPMITSHAGKITVWEPIVDANLLGWVKAVYSFKAVESIRKTILLDGVVNGLLVVAVSVVLILIFLGRYMAVFNKVTTFAGSLNERVGEQLELSGGIIEIDELIYGLNNTSQKLQSQERGLRESESRLKEIINVSASGFIVTNEQLRVELFNPAAEKIFGYKESEVMGENVSLLMPEPYRSRHDGYAAEYIATGIKKVIGSVREVRGQRKDGSSFPAELVVSEMAVDGKRKFVGLITDISQRKEQDEALRVAKEELDQYAVDLADKNRELSVAVVEAQAASQAKSDFLASMSHEIRTPMNAIIGMADLLGETELSSEQKQYVNIFRNAGENLLSIINDILDISKIEAGHFVLEEICFDLREVLERTGEVMAMRAHQKQIELVNSFPPDMVTAVVGDPTRLRQVLVNLLSNAIKFTEHGEIVMEVEMVSESTDDITLRFSVRDTGIGISSEKLDLIFDKFTQGDTSITRQYGGTGLGLAISRKIVEMMGGEFHVESVDGHGSVFSFTARFAVTPACSRSISIEELDLDGLRILVVDDNETNRLILRKFLGYWRADVCEVENGESALAELAKASESGDPYSLILLDYHMPTMDGMAVAEKIKNEMGLDWPIIMLSSANVGREQLLQIRQLGLKGYTTKPVKLSELRFLIQSALGVSDQVAEKSMVEEVSTDQVRSLRILLAEDNADNRNLVTAYLKKSPHQLDYAENGRIAVEKFIEGSYDLVLMDIEMPEMDGYTATRKIREFEKENSRRQTPVIALTAHALREHHEKSIEAGCNDHVSKPIKKAALLELLETV